MSSPTVYEAHRSRLPPLRPYARNLWAGRHLAVDLARTEVKAEHQNTVLGRAWQLLSPLLLAMAYLFLFEVIGGGRRGIGFLAFLLSGLFTFYYTRTSLIRGSNAVVGGGALVTNTRLPRAVLPAAAVIVAFRAFIPSIVVYTPFHIWADFPVTPSIAAIVPLIALLTLFNYGLALLFAAANVYFRDIRNALPFFVRIWLYVSPVLYATDDVPERLRPVIWANPMSPFLQSVHNILDDGAWPSVGLWSAMVAWAVGGFVIGAFVFVWREREFAVRL